MAKKTTFRKYIKKNGMLILSAVFTLSSVGVGTYAWFVGNRVAKNDFNELNVGKGLDVEVYAFNGNYEKDENNELRMVGYDRDKIINTINNYTTFYDETNQDISLLKKIKSSEEADSIFDIDELNPGTVFTLAFSVKNLLDYTVDVSLDLLAFSSGPEDDQIDGNAPYYRHTENGTEIQERIYLSRAIKMNTVSIYDSESEADKLTTSKTHITSSILPDQDKFTDTTNGSNFSPTQLAETTDLGPDEIAYVFYTIEFSGDQDTWFESDGHDSTLHRDYFKNPGSASGFSNAYQNGTFEILKLSLNISNYH